MRFARLVDGALEATVVGSFTSIGPRVRRRLDDWTPLGDIGLAGRTVVLTGVTSGLGLAAARQLAANGAHVHGLGRSPEKLAAVADEFRERGWPFSSGVADLADLDDVEAFATDVASRFERIDALVHNAGALVSEVTTTPQGLELTTAVHLVSPFVLTSRLAPLLGAADDARVIWVTSGGMYTAPLDVEAVTSVPPADDFDGVTRYAQLKRAQVELLGRWADTLPEATTHAMHPGWADTPGVVESLPTFHRVMGPLLRTPEQGADTLTWLVAAPEAARDPGQLWLDRRPRSTHRLASTRRSITDEAVSQLWDWCSAFAAPPS